jgi:transposase
MPILWQTWRVITVEDWAEIRRLYLSERMPIKAICRKLGLSRNTVRNAVRSVAPPRYARPAKGSIVDAVEPQIRDLLKAWPDMPTTVIAERIGWDRSLSVLKDRVRVLRPVFAPVDPASRTTYLPGERAQCDLWFPPIDVPLGFGQLERPPVMVMVSGYSRWLSATMLPTRTSQDLVLGQWSVIRQLGAVPRSLVWDNESGVGRYGGATPKLTAQFTALKGMLGTRFVLLRPRDPESKGMVERANGFIETSFLPGRVFTSTTDFGAQLTAWIAKVNVRPRRALDGAAAADRIGADRAAMGVLPPMEASSIGWLHSVVLPRDHWIRLDTCDYSVHPSAIGHRVDVHADLREVRVTRGGYTVGVHQRCWARQQTITDDAHAAASTVMRQAFQDRPRGGRLSEVAYRDLGDYDRIFDVDIDIDDDQANVEQAS